jgi:hypothetical protein
VTIKFRDSWCDGVMKVQMMKGHVMQYVKGLPAIAFRWFQ